MQHRTTRLVVIVAALMALFCLRPALAATLAAGSAHTCSVADSGHVLCWGDNGRGPLGDGSCEGRSVPVKVKGLDDVTARALGSQHSCALRAGGEVYCWGSNIAGELGDGTDEPSPVPVRVKGIPAAVELQAAPHRTCAIAAGGEVYCWGSFHQLWLEPGPPPGGSVLPPRRVPSLEPASTLVMGGRLVCTGTADGVHCGDPGSFEVKLSPLSPSSVRGWAAGDGGVCGFTESTTVHCWRSSIGGASQVTRVHDVPALAEMAVGGGHFCGRTEDHRLLCWGENGHGQLGDGLAPWRSEPSLIMGSNTAAVGLGWDHACSISTGGEWLTCQGASVPLGAGLGPDRLFHSIRVPFGGVTAVAAGGAHTCLLRAGEVLCFGDNLDGQLGIPGSFEHDKPNTPALSDAMAVALGRTHSCAITTDERVWCWGGSYGDQAMPVGLAGVHALSAGADHTCALDREGSVWCWGDNEFGQAAVSWTSALPTKVEGLPPATAIAAGDGHTCVLLHEGTVRCWGKNTYGQLGTDPGSGWQAWPPGVAQNLPGAIGLAAGGDHTCALKDNGHVQCWGRNHRGQLGRTDPGNDWAPAWVMDIDTATKVIARGDRTCVLTDVGGLSCWGDNARGVLGNGGTAGHNPQLREVAALSRGGGWFCQSSFDEETGPRRVRACRERPSSPTPRERSP